MSESADGRDERAVTRREVGPLSLPAAALRALRPRQWLKNLILYAALVFSGTFTDLGMALQATLGVIAFCLVSSSGYILNDYLDREADRRHPKKRLRPIASGALPEPVALGYLVVVAVAGGALAWWISPLFLFATLAYLATTFSYSFYFKHIVILDVMFIAAGFVIRALAGAVAIEVAVSPWFFLCAFFFALFLGFSKRRSELIQLGDAAGTRRNLVEYTPQMLTEFQAVVTGSVVLSYALYAVLGPSTWMVLTVPHVLYCIFRWVYLVERHGEGGAPEDTLLGDRPLLLTVSLYAITVMFILYGQAQGWLPAEIAWSTVG